MYRGGRGRGGRRGGRGGGHSSRQSSSDETDKDYSRPRPPPHLKGKEIGLWHAARSRFNKEKKDLRPVVDLDPTRRTKIAELLRQLDESVGGSPAAVDSEFMRRYKQNLFDNARSKQGSLFSDGVCEDLKKSESSDQHLKEQLEEKQKSRRFQEMMTFRQKLPAYQHKDEFLRLIAKNQVIVISGETGCGKTTQCCQLILDELINQGNGSQCRIVCTQPRRISAISVAERVAQERDEPIGKSVGYCIRLESRLPSVDRGTILFCTTGVVFQYLKDDPTLSKFSHIVVDEIHERDVLSDFLLTILKDLINIRPDLKVILMSATINAEKFSEYFGNVPCFNIPGFTFPVEEFYLEDVLEKTRFVFDSESSNSSRGGFAQGGRGGRFGGGRGGRFKHGYNPTEEDEFQGILESHLRQLEKERKYPARIINELRKPGSEELNLDLVCALLDHISRTDTKNGAVLIFVPGWDQISKLNNLLKDSGKFNPSTTLIIPLHSMMPTVNQKEVFARPPPGKRKVIIATNIAETSITIDDIVYVIDCGRIKLTNFNEKMNIESLDTEFVSLANAKQRKGRAGRVQEGVCYHLFSKARLLTLEQFKKPEILRKRLEEVVLQIKTLRLGMAADFLKRVMDPPSTKSVELGVERLIQIHALDDDENLTPLGFHLSHLPMDPQTGKMILMAAIFSCVDPILTIAATLSFKDPFYMPLGQEKNVDRVRKQFGNNSKSDHLALVNAFQGWERAYERHGERDFCYRNFLSGNTLQLIKNMKDQFVQHLHKMKFLHSDQCKDPESNIQSENTALVLSVLAAGLYPNVARSKGCWKISTKEDGRVEISRKSVNYGDGDLQSPYLVYFEKMKTAGIVLYDTSMVTPFSLIFFGGRLDYRREKGGKGVLVVDGFYEFLIDKPLFELVQGLRNRLDKLLEEKVVNPGPTCWHTLSKEGAILKAISQLITAEYAEIRGDGPGSDSDSDD